MFVEIVYYGIWIIVFAHVTHNRPKDSLLAHNTLPELIELRLAILDLHIGRLRLRKQMLAVHKIASNITTDHHTQLINA